MTEVFKVKVCGTAEMLEIQDSEPLSSASKYKQLSDFIWAQRPENSQLSSHLVSSDLSPPEVRDTLNEIAGEVNEKLIISGIGKALYLGQIDRDSDPIAINAEIIDNPVSVAVETFNWDEGNVRRYTEVNGKKEVVEFTDGHRDYYRELCIKLGLGRDAVATYSIQRRQTYQSDTTELFLNVWHKAFAEMDYAGHQIVDSDLTEQQENRILDLIQRMVNYEAS